MRSQTKWVYLFFVFFYGLSTRGAQPYPIDFELGGPESDYTRAIVQRIKNWPPKGLNFPAAGENPVKVTRMNTPEKSLYIGAEQLMIVKAPLETVEKVLDDAAGYQQIFPDYVDVHITDPDRNRYTVVWEHDSPFFFIPNEHYQTYYIVDKSSKNRKIYRYQLKAKTKHLKLSDGLIVIERAGAETKFTEYDFWDFEYGIAAALAPGRIWRESLEGLYLSDLGIKLRAEQSDWKAEKIREESKKILEKFPIDTNIIKEPLAISR